MAVIVAFAWGAFWVGWLAGIVTLVVGLIVYLELAAAERLATQGERAKMNADARQVREELYRERREEVRRELEERP